MMQWVSFDKKDKKVIGTSIVYGENGSWKKEYLPQRFDAYDYKKHMIDGDVYLGVALPSKEAPSWAFDGIVCIDVDTRGNDNPDVWSKFHDYLFSHGLASNSNVEKNKKSYHVWVKIPVWLQERIVKSDEYKTSAKLHMTSDSSIDFIFGSKCIRTATGIVNEDGYQSESRFVSRMDFENLPFMSEDMVMNLLENKESIFLSTDYKKSPNDFSTEIRPGNYGSINGVNMVGFLKSIINVKYLISSDSYTMHTKAIMKVIAINKMYGVCLIDEYMELFPETSKGRDSGLKRNFESFNGYISNGLIRYVERSLNDYISNDLIRYVERSLNECTCSEEEVII